MNKKAISLKTRKIISVILLVLVLFSPVTINLILSGMSYYNYSHGNFKTAEKSQLLLVKYNKTFLGENNSFHLKSIEELADLYCVYGYFNKSLDLLNSSYRIREKYNLFESFEGLYLLDRTANLKILKENYTDAKNLINKSIDISNKLYKTSSNKYIDENLNLIYLEAKFNHVENAKHLINQLKLDRNNVFWFKKLGGFYIIRMGRYFSTTGENLKAISLYEGVLSHLEKNNDPFWHCQVLIELANLYLLNKDYIKSAKTFQILLNTGEKNYKNTVLLSNIYTDYGILNLTRKDFNNANLYFLKSFEIRKKLLNPNHPKVICSQYFYNAANNKKNLINIDKIKLYKPINNNQLSIDNNNLTEYCSFVELNNEL